MEIENINILLIINILFTLVCLYICWNKKAKIEGFDDDDSINESIMNIASVLNTKNMKVSNLIVDNNADIKGNAVIGGSQTVDKKISCGSGKVGLWEIRGTKLGIPGRGDMDMGADKWIRNYNYNSGNYAPNGFAGGEIWSANNIYSNGIVLGGKTIDRNGNYIRFGAPVEVNYALGGSGMGQPGVVVNNLVLGPSQEFSWGQNWWTGPAKKTAIDTAKKLPKGSLVIGPPIDSNNNQDREWVHLVATAKRLQNGVCDTRAMYMDFGKHGGAYACK
jgi:hypothetical protein